MQYKCPYRVVLADDHVLFRCDLKRLFSERSDLEIVGEAGDGVELLDLLCLMVPVPQMAIVDLAMPHMGGIKATTAIKHTYPGMKVLILSMHRERQYVQGAFAAGADGYLLKENADAELFTAMEKIRQGGVYIPSHLAEAGRF